MFAREKIRNGLRSGIAICAALLALFAASPALAQLCPYNSTQATCACPTSGGGTTCFGGQIYRSTDGSCQNDTRPPGCGASQQFNCASASCQCSAGTTLCASSGACVANRACPAGLTWDVCTDTCTTPYVLLSPPSDQTGGIMVTGDVSSSAGDLYLSNGKAIRVDGAGATSLNIGNWGGGTFSLNVPGTNSNLCLNGTCRTSWPAVADFNPTYINTTGDTMTGDLSLTGASTDLFVAGNLGVGTTTPTAKLQVSNGSVLFTGTTGTLPATGAGTRFEWYAAKGALRAGAVTGTQWDDAQIGTNSVALTYNSIASGTSSFAVGDTSTASGFGSAAIGERAAATGASSLAFGRYVTASGANSIAMGSGWTFASPLNNATPQSLAIGFNSTEPTMLVTGSNGFGTGHGEVGIGTSWDNLGLANHKLTVKSDPNHGGIKIVAPSATWYALTIRDNTDSIPYLIVDSAGQMQYYYGPARTNSANGMVLTSDASGHATWQTATGAISSVSGSGAGISVSPTTGAVVVRNVGVTSLVNGVDNTVSAATGNVAVNNTSTLQTVTNRGATTNLGISVGSSSVTYGVDAQGTSNAVYGTVWGANGNAVYGNALNASNATGVNGQGTNTGVFGSGNTYGVRGQSGNYGVSGYTSGSAYGVWGGGPSALAGVYGTSNTGNGVEGLGGAYGGVFSSSTGTGMAASTTSGGRAVSAQNSGSGYGVYATSGSGTGVYGSGANSFYGVGLLYNSSGAAFGGGTPNAAIGVNATGSTYAIYASSPYHAITAGGGAYGVYGAGDTYGVKGYSGYNTGVYAQGGSVGLNAYGSTYGVTSSGSYSFYGTGTLYNSGETYINNGWLRVYGNAGIYFQSYGGGWFMQDGTWIRSYGAKPVYMDTGFDTGGASGIGCYGGLGGGYTFRVCGSEQVTGNFYTSGSVNTSGGIWSYYDIFLYTSAAWKYGGGSWLVFSDARSKENVHSFTDGLDVLKKIDPVNYTYNGLANSPKGYEGIGVIAQDIAKVAPYTIQKRMGKLHPEDKEETELYSVDPSALTYVTINAIKELDATTVKVGAPWGEGSGWRSCTEDEECACPDGFYMTKVRHAGTEIYCNKL